jgi:hypothetical protein
LRCRQRHRPLRCRHRARPCPTRPSPILEMRRPLALHPPNDAAGPPLLERRLSKTARSCAQSTGACIMMRK